MCDCAEEAERRKKLALANAAAGGAGGRGRGGRSNEYSSGAVVRYVFASTALLFGTLAILHKYLGVLDPVIDAVAPILESWGIIEAGSWGSGKGKCPKRKPDDACGLQINPCKRKWPRDEEPCIPECDKKVKHLE